MGNERRSRELQLGTERHAIWERLRTEPWLPDDPRRPFESGTPRIRIIHLPSFKPSSFWEVCQFKDNWLLYTARVVKDRYSGPLMVQGYEAIEIPSEKLREHFHRLVALVLPIGPDLSNTSGLDGHVTQLAILGDLNSEVRFHWWAKYPEPWSPLVRQTEDMMAAFSSARGVGASEPGRA